MTLAPRLRKFALTTHVVCSVGWLGSVASFLALAIAGVTSDDAQMVRAAYLAMELTGWFVIVPLSLASLITGIIQSLGTQWGFVPALLDSAEAPANDLCHHRFAATHAANEPPRRRSCADGIVQR